MIDNGTLTGYEIAALHGIDIERGPHGPSAFVDRATGERVTGRNPVQLRLRMMEHITREAAPSSPTKPDR